MKYTKQEKIILERLGAFNEAESGRKFHPGIPTAKVAPEYENVKTFHRQPEMQKLRNTRLLYGERAFIDTTKDEYTLRWSSFAGYEGARQRTTTLTFFIDKPKTFQVITSIWSRDDNRTKQIASKKGTGSIEQAIRMAKQMGDKLSSDDYGA